LFSRASCSDVAATQANSEKDIVIAKLHEELYKNQREARDKVEVLEATIKNLKPEIQNLRLSLEEGGINKKSLIRAIEEQDAEILDLNTEMKIST
jgi:septal ring factor EnvC (AmiA/AmiB activator)